LPPIKAGLLRPLGVSSTERIGDLPDVPTMADGLSRQRLVWSSCTRQDSG
jgi:tripartite-type tricarboxylate transporter receptor subunit TctC